MQIKNFTGYKIKCLNEMSCKNFRAIYTKRDENFYGETKLDEAKIKYKQSHQLHSLSRSISG